MKQVVAVVVAALTGMVLGNYKPQAELDMLRARLDALEDVECVDPSFGADLARLMSSGKAAARSPNALPKASRPAAKAHEGAQEDTAAYEVREQMRSDFGKVDEMNAARTALDMRAAQARAALFQDADLDDEQVDDFEHAISSMNAELMDLADELVTRIEQDGDITRRDAMAFAADALDTMIVAEDRIVDTLDDDQLAAADDGSIDPFSYVDGDLISVLERLGQ